VDDLESILKLYIRGVWRRKWLVMGIAWLVCVAGWTFVYFIPGQYQSSARVYINVDGLLTPLLHGLTVDTNSAQQLDYMHRTLLSRPNLQQIAHLAYLDKPQTKPAEQELMLATLGHDISVAVQGQHLFSISYTNPDPVTAKNVVQGVLTVFAESTAGNNQADINNASHFLDQQITNYEQQLRAAEARRAKFREEHADVLPDVGSIGTRLEHARADVTRDRSLLADATAKEEAIKKEVASVPQFLNVDQAPTVIIGGGNGPSATQRRLDDARQRLSLLRSQYTDEYPDVITTKRTIATLETELAGDRSGQRGGSARGERSRHSTVASTLYEQMKLKLVDQESTVAALQRQLTDAQNEESRLQFVLTATPQVELQAQNLDRDYDVVKKNFEELLGRREAARLAEAADVESDQRQFRIVDAPEVPVEPASPNRPLLYSGVMIAGIAAGLGAAVFLLQLDRSFSTAAGLRALGFPVIGSVSVLNFLHSRKRATREATGFGAIAVALLVVYIMLLATSFGLRSGIV
jgi:polysaccharide chain length determinant protein (PEP-CTERM system associated)